MPKPNLKPKAPTAAQLAAFCPGGACIELECRTKTGAHHRRSERRQALTKGAAPGHMHEFSVCHKCQDWIEIACLSCRERNGQRQSVKDSLFNTPVGKGAHYDGKDPARKPKSKSKAS